MFGFFKKKEDKHADLIAAVRSRMKKRISSGDLPKLKMASSMDVFKHIFKRKFNSAEEAEKEHMVSNPRLGDKPVPFGFNHEQWRKLLAEMQDGDELWTFNTSEESWDNGCGRSGIALLRNSKEIFYIVCKMN